MHSYCTVHQLTCPGTSQQNGRAKQKLRHIFDNVRAFLLSAKVPAPFWSKVALHALHALHAINRIPSPVIQNQTPYERLFGSPPAYHHLRSFDLLVSFFFSHMSITNLSLDQGFIVFLAIAKFKRGIGVMILSLIVFVSPAMLSFGKIAPLSSSLTSVPLYLPPLS